MGLDGRVRECRGEGIFAIFSAEKLIIADFSIFLTIGVTERKVSALIE